jgi:drug/metabolite transporter (DMT)-like permease
VLAAIVAALASAACFALGSALQHRAAGSTLRDNHAGPRLILALLKQRSWLLGLGMSGVAFGLHVVALGYGDLSLVQPVIVSGIVFAVILRSVLDHRRPSKAETSWCLLTWAGLALFIAVMPPRPENRPDPQYAAWFVAGGLALVAVLVLLSGRRSTATRRGILLAVSAGVLFGLVAGLVKLVLTRVDVGLMALLGDWSVWAMAAVGLSAVALNQRAYQVTRLSVSSPVLNMAQMAVSISFGLVVFSERLAESPLVLALQILGLVLIGIGVRQLAVREERAEADRREATAPRWEPVRTGE